MSMSMRKICFWKRLITPRVELYISLQKKTIVPEREIHLAEKAMLQQNDVSRETLIWARVMPYILWKEHCPRKWAKSCRKQDVFEKVLFLRKLSFWQKERYLTERTLFQRKSFILQKKLLSEKFCSWRMCHCRKMTMTPRKCCFGTRLISPREV